jgi:hypothetical protein
MASEPTQPSIQRVPESVSSAVKRWRRGAQRSSEYIAEVKNGGAISPLPHMPSWHSAELQNYVQA